VVDFNSNNFSYTTSSENLAPYGCRVHMNTDCTVLKRWTFFGGGIMSVVYFCVWFLVFTILCGLYCVRFFFYRGCPEKMKA